MTAYGCAITTDAGANFVAGDAFGVTRTITDIGSGRTLAKAYLTVKASPTDADPGALQLAITTTLTGAGQITDTGASGTGTIAFTVSSSESASLGSGRAYLYDIRLIFDDGEPVTPEVGSLVLGHGVTTATS